MRGITNANAKRKKNTIDIKKRTGGGKNGVLRGETEGVGGNFFYEREKKWKENECGKIFFLD